MKSEDLSEVNGMEEGTVILLSSCLHALQFPWHLCIRIFYLLSFLEEKMFSASNTCSLFASPVYF